ncbi:MAG: type II secretion system protein [Gammaproteobacteria bacterium]
MLRKKAFSLIELMLVVLIISVLLSMAYRNYQANKIKTVVNKLYAKANDYGRQFDELAMNSKDVPDFVRKANSLAGNFVFNAGDIGSCNIQSRQFNSNSGDAFALCYAMNGITGERPGAAVDQGGGVYVLCLFNFNSSSNSSRCSFGCGTSLNPHNTISDQYLPIPCRGNGI